MVYSLAEMFAIIQQALIPQNWSVIVEARSNGRADIFIQNGHRIVIELKSGSYYRTEEDLLVDVQQGVQYGPSLKADRIVLLNIVPDWMLPHAAHWTPKYTYTIGELQVFVINVQLRLQKEDDKIDGIPHCSFNILPSCSDSYGCE